jgi:hypothetical protein
MTKICLAQTRLLNATLGTWDLGSRPASRLGSQPVSSAEASSVRENLKNDVLEQERSISQITTEDYESLRVVYTLFSAIANDNGGTTTAIATNPRDETNMTYVVSGRAENQIGLIAR